MPALIQRAAHRHDTGRNFRALRAEVRAAVQNPRADVRADSAYIHGDLAGLRRDNQTLTTRMARIERFLVGCFAERGSHDRPGRQPQAFEPLPPTIGHAEAGPGPTVRATV